MTDNINSAAESQQSKQAQPSEQQPQPSGQTGVIYKITCLVNGKSYVGPTRQGLSRRITEHKRDSNKDRPGIDAAIHKYGWENFTVEVLEECPVEQLNDREIFWIAELNTKVPNGYNLTDGGEGGLNPSDEVRARISATSKGRCPNKGNHHTAEAKAKISAVHKGKPFSEEHKAKIRANHADVSGEKNPHYGKKHSPEAKAKMSAAHMGKPSPNKGKPSPRKGKKCSPETCAKMSAARKGKKGKPRSPETKAKIAASVRATLAKKKLESQNNS